MSKNEMLFTGLSIFNGVYSIATIENIFSLILLCFQILLLVVGLVIKIYKALKDRKLSANEIKDITDTINKIDDKIDDIKGGNKSE